MNGGGWAWTCGWLAAAVIIPCALAAITERYRARRIAALRARAAQAARDADAAWLDTIGVDWPPIHSTEEAW